MPDAASSPIETELTTRPDPGLGRGRYEGSPRLIVGLGVLVFLAFVGFLLWKVRRDRRAERGNLAMMTGPGTKAFAKRTPQRTEKKSASDESELAEKSRR